MFQLRVRVEGRTWVRLHRLYETAEAALEWANRLRAKGRDVEITDAQD
jgi:hypothetical protein